MINAQTIEKSITYQAYFDEMIQFQESGKTSGLEQSESRISYTSLNTHRMKRWEKSFKPSEELWSTLPSKQIIPQIWLVLSESWCGDAAQNLPIIHKIINQFDAIEMRFIFRDEHLDIMDEFLTDGSRSIPKLICLDQADLKVIDTWGPRPETAQNMLKAYKANPAISNEEFKKDLHLWYAKDKGKSVEKEIFSLIKSHLKQ